MILIASTVLFDFFYLSFKMGISAETMSRDYEILSSGIYYGVWLADHGQTSDTLPIDGVTVSVMATLNDDGSYTITAGAPSSRTITVQYSNPYITSWN